jgi:DNA-binding GntR family transcriptional regulator
MEIITRKALRSDVHTVLKNKILAGGYSTRQKLKDTELSEMLGVSRTPVREALLRLEREGLIENRVGRGFRVRPLEKKEVREIYPIIRSLEALALTHSAPLAKEAEARMRLLEVKMLRVGGSPARRIAWDQAWHWDLLSGNSNESLHRLLRDLKSRSYRYEYAFMSVPDHSQVSVVEHRTIRAAVAKGRVSEAVKCLMDHWDTGMKALLRQIELNDAKEIL